MLERPFAGSGHQDETFHAKLASGGGHSVLRKHARRSQQQPGNEKEQAKEKQIIITTHSPQVLNILSENELDHIITTRYDAEKGTTMHHLTDDQKQVARNYIEEGFSLGDAWVYSTQFEQATEEEEMG